MTVVYRILMVHFDERARFVVDLLIKSHRNLAGVNFFDVASLPALTAHDIEPVPSSAAGKSLPARKFPLILFTRTHPCCRETKGTSVSHAANTYNRFVPNCLLRSLNGLLQIGGQLLDACPKLFLPFVNRSSFIVPKSCWLPVRPELVEGSKGSELMD